MAMKESGIEWVGLIPDDWKIAKNNRLFNISKQLVNENWKNTQLLSLTKSGIIEKNINDGGGKQPESFGTYQYVEKDDIVLCLFDIDVSAVFSDRSKYDGMISPAYRVMKCTDAILPVYAKWWFDAVNIGRYYLIYTKSLRKTIDADGFGNILTVVPPLSEQQSIADYLDETCSKIDEIIAEAKASIEEYKELKQSILFETMTRGIQSDRKYKTCDYEWLGKVPEDWSLMKITHILDDNDSYPIGDGDHGLIKTDSYKSEGIPYIRVQNIGWGTPLLMDNVVYISKEDNERIKGSQLKPGDVLFVKTGATIGKTAIVPNNIPISNTTSHVGKITVSKEHNSKYIFYLLSSFIGYKQFWDIACMKATRPELSISEIKQMKVLIPSTRDEEDEIVEYLDNKLPEYETLICIKESLINDLEAYKKSLIYEVVTGKRRVV